MDHPHDICPTCSALVNNLQGHIAWHRDLQGEMAAQAQHAVKAHQAQINRKKLGESEQ